MLTKSPAQLIKSIDVADKGHSHCISALGLNWIFTVILKFSLWNFHYESFTVLFKSFHCDLICGSKLISQTITQGLVLWIQIISCK